MKREIPVAILLYAVSVSIAIIPLALILSYSHPDNQLAIFAATLGFFAILAKFFTAVPIGYKGELILFGIGTGIYFNPGYYLTPNLDFGMMANNLGISFGFRIGRLIRTDSPKPQLLDLDLSR